ncbi:hypothetical protein [Streptomyces sp. NP-1717]|uniref:hypothetical protein n=1 Tax=Streptomyces sp. NP-1717 TaxID=2704470 RepID=UPI001F5CB873|nr:hypothetical protein [Streptomyces sp. NP-1717]MCI3224276.1 hypothetical protein [Streptomyces sp. NP-1717]
MPRPTAAQLAYGSATVVLATLSMLLLSGVTSVVGIAVIALVALCLGVLVSVKAAEPRRSPAARPATGRTDHATTSVASDRAAGSPSAETRVPASLRR